MSLAHVEEAMAQAVALRSLDGTPLAAKLHLPEGTPRARALLAHGIMSEKTESGLYDSLAMALVGLGFVSLGVDLRGHGESAGEQQDFTISGALNDIRAGADYLREVGRAQPLVLVGASFSGGLCIYLARHLLEVDRLILLNPRLDYSPWIYESTLFKGGTPDPAAQQKLQEWRGSVAESGYWDET